MQSGCSSHELRRPRRSCRTQRAKAAKAAKEVIVAASCQLIGNTFAGRWQLTQPAQQEAAKSSSRIAGNSSSCRTRTLRLASFEYSCECVSASASVSECECVRVKLFKQLSDSISNNQTTNKCERVQPNSGSAKPIKANLLHEISHDLSPAN